MLSYIQLQNFRAYSKAKFEFNSGINIIVGPNACGKTSLLEAILVLATGKSYRVKDSELIKFKSKWTRIEGSINSHSRIVKISNDPPLKTISIDGKESKRLNFEQKIPVVLFEPNDILLINGSPDGRRDYLDNVLTYNVSGYKTLLAQYNRALHQRNTLLKTSQLNKKDVLFPWNIRLSQLGGQITLHRKKLVEQLNKQLPEIYKGLSQSDINIAVEYKTQIEIESFESKFLRKLENNIEEDMRLGFTRFGPHRDDLLFLFNNHESDIYASRGEVRSITLSLKLAELKMIEQVIGHKPLFLLDDVFSELDGSRRQSLAELLKDYQSFITTTDADLALKYFKKHRKILPLSRVL